MNKNVNIVTDLDGRKIALINDIRFQSRRSIDWNEVEECLKEYVGEYSHSKDTKSLKGANMKAKANIVSAIKNIVEIASDRIEYPDYNNKHGSKAKFGWY